MKYLLCAINAKYIHSNPAVFMLKAFAPRRYRDQIEIAQYTINEYPSEILAKIYARHPDVLAFSCYIWNISHVRWLTREIHKVLPGTRIFLGGPEVSWNAARLLREMSEIEGIFAGEGEIPFCRFVEAMEENGYPDNIPGLITRRTDAQHAVPVPVPDLDDLPFIYDENEFGLEPFRNHILYYESSRGCPFSCSYCLSSRDGCARHKSTEKVTRELQYFLDHNLKQVKFLDRSFNCSEKHAMAIWNHLKQHDNGITNFHFEMEPDLISPAQAALLLSLRPGLVQLEIGVQSTNRRTLEAVGRFTSDRRGPNTAGTRQPLNPLIGDLIQGGNMHIHLDLIAGLPFEDYESFRRSFNDVYAFHPHELQLGFLKVLHGTALESDTARYGIRCQSEAPYEVLATDWLDYDEIIRLKKVEKVLGIYYNSGQFSRTIRVLEKYFPDAFSMYESLAEFFSRKGYFGNTPARIRRYDILLQFIGETLAPYQDAGDSWRDMFRELLTFDAYLRESLKSRPAFAPDRPHSRRSELYHEETITLPLEDLQPYGPAPLPADLRPGRPKIVRFDYSRRDPVTHNAAIQFYPG